MSCKWEKESSIVQASIKKIKNTNIGLPIHIIFDDFYDKQSGALYI
jgi:hypothetical protein